MSFAEKLIQDYEVIAKILSSKELADLRRENNQKVIEDLKSNKSGDKFSKFLVSPAEKNLQGKLLKEKNHLSLLKKDGTPSSKAPQHSMETDERLDRIRNSLKRISTLRTELENMKEKGDIKKQPKGSFLKLVKNNDTNWGPGRIASLNTKLPKNFDLDKNNGKPVLYFEAAFNNTKKAKRISDLLNDVGANNTLAGKLECLDIMEVGTSGTQAFVDMDIQSDATDAEILRDVKIVDKAFTEAINTPYLDRKKGA